MDPSRGHTTESNPRINAHVVVGGILLLRAVHEVATDGNESIRVRIDTSLSLIKYNSKTEGVALYKNESDNRMCCKKTFL